MTDLVFKAMEFAEFKHAEQKRKYTGLPYFTHLHNVAVLVGKRTNKPELVAAAYLHDTLEDTDTTYHELVIVFGEEIANLVLELTDVFTSEAYPDWNRAIRKAKECARLATVSDDAKLIKRCDIEDNTADIEVNDPGFAKTYLPEKEAILRVIS